MGAALAPDLAEGSAGVVAHVRHTLSAPVTS